MLKSLCIAICLVYLHGRISRYSLPVKIGLNSMGDCTVLCCQKYKCNEICCMFNSTYHACIWIKLENNCCGALLTTTITCKHNKHYCNTCMVTISQQHLQPPCGLLIYYHAPNNWEIINSFDKTKITSLF